MLLPFATRACANRLELAEAVFEHAQLAAQMEALEAERREMNLPGDSELMSRSAGEATSELFWSAQLPTYAARTAPSFGTIKCLTVAGPRERGKRSQLQFMYAYCTV